MRIWPQQSLVCLTLLVLLAAACARAPQPSDPPQAAAAPGERPQAEPAPPEGSPGKITVMWETQSETGCYGYYVYRSESETGPFARVNKDIVAGGGTTHTPRSYRVVDQPLPVGRVYYYRIEQVDLNGNKQYVGPVKMGQVRKSADPQYLEETQGAK